MISLPKPWLRVMSHGSYVLRPISCAYFFPYSYMSAIQLHGKYRAIYQGKVTSIRHLKFIHWRHPFYCTSVHWMARKTQTWDNETYILFIRNLRYTVMVHIILPMRVSIIHTTCVDVALQFCLITTDILQLFTVVLTFGRLVTFLRAFFLLVANSLKELDITEWWKLKNHSIFLLFFSL